MCVIQHYIAHYYYLPACLTVLLVLLLPGTMARSAHMMLCYMRTPSSSLNMATRLHGGVEHACPARVPGGVRGAAGRGQLGVALLGAEAAAQQPSRLGRVG